MVRVKRRYVLFEVIPSDQNMSQDYHIKLSEKEIIHAMRRMIEAKYGNFGLGTILKSLHVKRFNGVTRIGIITIKRGPHVFLTSSMPFIKEINSFKCSLRTFYLSGTIRGCLRKLKLHHQIQIKQHENDLEKAKKLSEGFTDLEVCLKRADKDDGDEVI
ncbi:Ribonuclease P/MRP protein subunit POP5 [Halotydeus destructor]|nr:Ribonuclease P/MRP protein subunit POP5 [Halotydeus destructor]